MMNYLNNKTVKVAAVVAFGSATLLLAGCKDHKHTTEHKANHMIQEISEEITLSADNQAKLAVVKDQLVISLEKYQNYRSNMATDLQGWLTSDEGVDELVELMEAATKPLTDNPALLSSITEFKNSLNDEQKQALAEELDHFKRKRK